MCSLNMSILVIFQLYDLSIHIFGGGQALYHLSHPTKPIANFFSIFIAFFLIKKQNKAESHCIAQVGLEP
jgi:hypothetical protein